MLRFAATIGLLMVGSLALCSAARADDKPTYTDLSNGGRIEVTYVLDKVTRNGREVTFALTATLDKGGDRKFNYFKMHAVDTKGKSYKDIEINYVRPGIYGLKDVELSEGVATGLEFTVKLPEGVTHLKTVDFTSAAVGRRAIKFTKIDIPE